jgi:hypothetical protein
MIYKFESLNGGIEAMEIKIIYGDCCDSNEETVLQFYIRNESDDSYFELTKQEVYKLIGALHLLHKEMK